MTTKFQTPQTRRPNRADHVWIYLNHKGCFKCVLCGAVAWGTPPPYPTLESWMPKCYEELTEEERLMCVDKGP